MPYHPWYAHLAGKRVFAHRMGILDVRYRRKYQVAGLKESLRAGRFAAVVLDTRPITFELGELRGNYTIALTLQPPN